MLINLAPALKVLITLAPALKLAFEFLHSVPQGLECCNTVHEHSHPASEVISTQHGSSRASLIQFFSWFSNAPLPVEWHGRLISTSFMIIFQQKLFPCLWFYRKYFFRLNLLLLTCLTLWVFTSETSHELPWRYRSQTHGKAWDMQIGH